MLNDSAGLLPDLAVLAMTYVLHSTAALGTAWLVLRLARIRSQAVHEQVWKAAAVLGAFTAAAQCGFGVGGVDLTVGAKGGRPVEPAGSQPMGEPGESSVSADAGVAWDDSVDVPAPELPPLPEPVLVTIDETAAGTAERTGSGAIAAPLADDVLLVEAPGDHASAAPVPIGSGVGAAGAAPQAEADHPPAAGPWWLAALGAAAALCLLSGGLRLVVQSVVLARRVASTRPIAAGPVRRELDRLVQRNGLRRRVRLLGSERSAEPFACGLVRWRIVVPVGIEDQLGRDELRGLLAHELAHLARGDAWWLWIGRVLCACLAFQPLNFVARRRWQRAGECLCDDWAVRSGASAVALARCLTRVAEWRTGRQLAGVALAVGGSRPMLTERVERLVGNRPGRERGNGSRWRHAVRVALVAAACLLLWCGPRASLPPADAAGPIADVDRSPASSDDDAEIQSELRRLDRELESLDRQMQRVSELFVRVRLAPEAEQIAQRLRRRAESVARRRAELTGPARSLSEE